jgi:hypothetical protein
MPIIYTVLEEKKPFESCETIPLNSTFAKGLSNKIEVFQNEIL